jgi:hypothetical protein
MAPAATRPNTASSSDDAALVELRLATYFPPLADRKTAECRNSLFLGYEYSTRGGVSSCMDSGKGCGFERKYLAGSGPPTSVAKRIRTADEVLRAAFDQGITQFEKEALITQAPPE